MPLGKRHRFSSREHEIAMRIKASEKKRGKDDEDAERIAWATLVKRRKKYGLRSLKKG